MAKKDGDQIVVAMREFFGPLVKLTRELPPLLGYSLAVVLSIVIAVVLRAVFPMEIVVLLGVVVLAGLVAFVWLSRARPMNRNKSIVTLHVVVHRENNRTAYIPGAEVRLSLPDPVIKHTDTNGGAIFASIPSKYAGKDFDINAAESGYKERSPEKCRIQDDETVFLSLVPLSEATDTSSVERESTEAGASASYNRSKKPMVASDSLQGFEDEELKRLLTKLYADKQIRKQLVTRADLFCSLVRRRIIEFDPSNRTRVIFMLDDIEQRLTTVSSPGEFEVTDSMKDLLTKARFRAKEIGEENLGVIMLMKVLLEDPGENITKGLTKHGFTPEEVLSGMRRKSIGNLFSE